MIPTRKHLWLAILFLVVGAAITVGAAFGQDEAQTFILSEDQVIVADDTAPAFIPSPMNYAISITANGESCNLDDLFAASKRLRWTLPAVSGDAPRAESMVYWTPAAQLRRQAAEIEARDAAIKAWREIEEKCERIYFSFRQIMLEEK